MLSPQCLLWPRLMGTDRLLPQKGARLAAQHQSRSRRGRARGRFRHATRHQCRRSRSSTPRWSIRGASFGGSGNDAYRIGDRDPCYVHAVETRRINSFVTPASRIRSPKDLIPPFLSSSRERIPCIECILLTARGRARALVSQCTIIFTKHLRQSRKDAMNDGAAAATSLKFTSRGPR